jgi:hypothetical protein
MPVIQDVSSVAKKAPDQPRKRAPGLKRDPPSRGGADGVKNIFEEYKTKDNRKSDAAFLADQYLRDDAVEAFMNDTRRKGHDFQSWLHQQDGDYLSALGTYYSNYAHQVWLKKQEHAKAEQGVSTHPENSKQSLQELARLGQRLASGRAVLQSVEE